MPRSIRLPAQLPASRQCNGNSIAILSILEAEDGSEDLILLRSLANYVLDRLAKLSPIIIEPFKTPTELASQKPLDLAMPARRLVIPWRLSITRSTHRLDGESLLKLLMPVPTFIQGTAHSLEIPLSVAFLKSHPEKLVQSPIHLKLLTHTIPGWDSYGTIWAGVVGSPTLLVLRSFQPDNASLTPSPSMLTRHANRLQLALQEDRDVPLTHQLDEHYGRLYFHYLIVLLHSTILRFSTWFREFNLLRSSEPPITEFWDTKGEQEKRT